MTEPLDVVTVSARQIIEEMPYPSAKCENVSPNVISLAGQQIVAGELRRLTTAVEKLVTEVRDFSRKW